MKITKIFLTGNTVSTSNYIFLFTLINMIIYQFPLYSYAFAHLGLSISGILTFASVLIALFMIISLLLFIAAVISQDLLKPVTVFIVIGNSIALYFILTYHVILDKTMMGNVFNTNASEALSFFHPKLFLFFILLGILPALFLFRIRIQKIKRPRLIAYELLVLVTGFTLLYLNSTTWLWIDKHAKQLGGRMMPAAYVVNAIRYQVEQLERSREQILLPSATVTDNGKMIVVLVIGESARSNNFSLLGYTRNTNPNLERLKVIALNGTSATTYTTASIHSMFSYTGSTSDDYEPLPNYLQRQGVDVIWRTNNWGEPKLNVESFEKDGELRKSCEGEHCEFDEVLLTNLSERINASTKEKIFIVLHTYGSHGPLYYKQYPKEFERFKPVCKTVDLNKCTRQELVNAYDNTVIYTDYFISRVIELLQQFRQVPSLMIYASDHGESLGEYGLYLHGTPYAIAPDVQKKVPFIFWASDSYIKKRGSDLLAIKQQHAYNHTNIFHTIMGAFDLDSSVYNKDLDILR